MDMVRRVLDGCLIDTKCPKLAQKISPTSLEHHHQPEPLTQRRTTPCFHVVYVRFWPQHPNLNKQFSVFYPVQFWWACVKMLFWIFCNNCLFELLWPSNNSKQSGRSPLTSGINEAFSPREVLLTGYSLFFGPFSVNPRDGWKIPEVALSKKFTAAHQDQP